MNTNKQRVLIVALFFLLTGSCAAYAAIDLPVRAGSQTDYMFKGSVERGALLYANNCRTCHGNQGEGFIGPQLNRSDWRDQDPVALAENRHLLTRTLNCGRAGTSMPAWLDTAGGALNERQIEHLVNFLVAPEDGESYLDEFGAPTSKGWVEALEFAHNLNDEITAVIGGDTLNLIATQHGIGARELGAANDIGVGELDDILPRGTRLDLPPNSAHPDGAVYQVRADNDTVAKLAGQLQIGAAIIADLNGLTYTLDYQDGSLTLLENGEPVEGLLVGTTLELPEGATYRVVAGDSLDSIAEQHGVSASDIRALNEFVLEGLEDDATLDGRYRLLLPGNTVVVGPDDTLAVVAGWYDLDETEFATLNELDPEAEFVEGQRLTLPEGSRYVVQELDSLDSIAAVHETDVATLLGLNQIEDPDLFSFALVLDMPKVDAYQVAVQTLEDAAQAFGNVTASSLAQANDIDVETPLRVGTVLVLPAAAYGTAPPNAVNNGTGCVQFAVADSAYRSIVLGETDFDPQEPPEEFTEELVIEGHANDWTIPGQPINQGVAKVRPGTVGLFVNVEPILHTVTIDGETLEANFGPAVDETFEFEFVDEGRYYITCDYHLDMRAWVFVVDE